ncbi:MAG: thioredoxin [Microbacterium sp.]|uniref:transglycosylase domain-containing protein n=1 Tax=Microbacterium aquimaris TaxID=459816 RepID=UPI000C90BD2C|nr:transglycosylase domain-containing protein [Microbacterium aquimaris]MAP62615.1 thioredoxin [Microbacterium sp.]MDZ8276928.1 transglycosylase domain-containing protein [Microbacterium aquimaris]
MPQKNRTASGVLGGILGLVGLSAVAGVLITATVTPAIAVTGAAASSAITMFDKLPSVLEIEKLMLPSTIYYKDSDGDYVELTQFYDQNREPVTYDEVAPVMYDAILSSEDPRYYQHGGVDLIGTTRALLSNAQGGATQGGSSISQQYVKNILIQQCESNAEGETNEEVAAAKLECWTEATTASGVEGYQRKLQEMRYAIALEQKYSKNDILLGYLNIANFGGTNYGIEAASRYYFNVSSSDLSIAQAATLAGIVQNPNTYRIDLPGGSITNSEGTALNTAPDGEVNASEGTLAALDTLLAEGTITDEEYLAAADGYTLTKGRQLYVLSRMLDDGKITEEQYVEAAKSPIEPDITYPATGCSEAGGSAFFCKYVQEVVANDPAFGETAEERELALRRGGLNIYTTLDIDLQLAAEQTMNDTVPQSIVGMDLGATTVSIEAETGRILSITQNKTFSENADADADPTKMSLVFAGDMQFGGTIGASAGSTFKLFTLIDWLEKGHSLNEVLNGRTHKVTRLQNSCLEGGVWSEPGADAIDNFNRAPGYVGRPIQFTADSLNSGFLAMAERLDLCDIQAVATKMGVTDASSVNGEPVDMIGAFSVLGDQNVSPIAVAGAYATVANGGVYCEPQAIDRVTDSDGNELPVPERSCERVLDESVAATAAYALQGVMNGGTGSLGNPYDGIPVIGKTGTHETFQTWLVESSTKVATAAWVGNIQGFSDVFDYGVAYYRYALGKGVQSAANAIYGGGAFPDPDQDLLRVVYTDLPNVVGMSIDQATATLEEAGFSVTLGEEVDSSEAAGIIAEQDPGAGRVAGGTNVTIRPSNGQGVTVPDVSGQSLEDAISTLRSEGFDSVQPGSCTATGGGGGDDDDDDENNGGNGNGNGATQVTGTSPGAGELVNRGDTISVNYRAESC